MEISLRKKEGFHNQHLVLGTAGLGGVWGKVDLSDSVGTIEYALDNGISVVDTAPAYGDAQLVLGKALANRKNNLPFISSKVGRLRGETADDVHYDYSTSAMEKSVVSTLKILGIDVLDVLFLHDPDAIRPDEIERIVNDLGMLKEKGYTRAVGLGGNFKNADFYQYINNEQLSFFQGYNRLNALTTEGMNHEFKHCIDHGVTTYAASPLNMGLLGRKLEQIKQERPEWIEAKILNKALEFEAMCNDKGEDMPSLAHRFLFSINEIDRVVIGGSKRYQIEQTLDVWKKGPLESDFFNGLLAFAQK